MSNEINIIKDEKVSKFQPLPGEDWCFHFEDQKYFVGEEFLSDLLILGVVAVVWMWCFI